MEYYLNGTKLQNGRPFTVGDLAYPWSYLEILSTAQLTSMGITQMKPASTFDPRYYWDTDLPKHLDDREESDLDGNPLYVQVWDPTFDNGADREPGAMVNTEKRLVSLGLKTTCIAEVNAKANSILANTDWYLYRLAERAVAVPQTVVTHRAAVVAEAQRLASAVDSATTVEQLIAVMATQVWDHSLNPTV